MRMHVHQKSDLWFNNEVDQASIWGLSQYLPNNVFMTPVDRMDDDSFNSAMATSLCLGWIADADDFDVERGHKLLDRYRSVRHLMIGAWYPLLPYSREPGDWIASQYHRPDLDEGMVLAFRRAESPQVSVDVRLQGLTPDKRYEVLHLDGLKRVTSGRELMHRLEIALSDRPGTGLIKYRPVDTGGR